MAQTITVKLSITPGGIPPVIHLSQYDKTARTLSFLLVDETGTYTVPSGASATIRGTKPDHTGFMYGCTIYGTTVSVAVQDQMTVCAGRVSCELRIAGSDGSILGTANFWLAIEATALADDTIVSKTDLPMVEKAAEAYDATKEAAAAALVSERNAKASETAAEDARAKAVQSAGEAFAYASQAKASKEAAVASETNAKSDADNAASSASAAAASQKAAATSETNAKASETAAKGYRDQAAGYAGAASFSFMVDSENYICLHYKEDTKA